MKINVEIEVNFDHGASGEGIESSEIADAISDAVSGCEGIENNAYVEVKKIKISQ